MYVHNFINTFNLKDMHVSMYAKMCKSKGQCCLCHGKILSPFDYDE